MKKFASLLFTFAIITASVFGLGSANALTINKDVYYDFYMTGGSDKLTMSIMDENNDDINKALVQFYRPESGAEIVNAITFKFSVKAENTWNKESDKAKMFINIPKTFNLDKKDHIYLMRIKSGGDYDVYEIGDKLQQKTPRKYEIKDYNSVKAEIEGDSVVSKGSNLKDDYFSNQYAVLETGDFESTGDTYYVLITCQGIELTTSSTTITTTATTTTTTKPSQTTTVENPKTGENSNQLYFIIGVIGVIGIAGLGIKFAKANK